MTCLPTRGQGEGEKDSNELAVGGRDLLRVGGGGVPSLRRVFWIGHCGWVRLGVVPTEGSRGDHRLTLAVEVRRGESDLWAASDHVMVRQ